MSLSKVCLAPRQPAGVKAQDLKVSKPTALGVEESLLVSFKEIQRVGPQGHFDVSSYRVGRSTFASFGHVDFDLYCWL